MWESRESGVVAAQGRDMGGESEALKLNIWGISGISSRTVFRRLH
jgi:hypothetical protein